MLIYGQILGTSLYSTYYSIYYNDLINNKHDKLEYTLKILAGDFSIAYASNKIYFAYNYIFEELNDFL